MNDLSTPLRVPVPLWFLGTFAGGVLLDAVLPLPRPAAPLRLAVHDFGLALLSAGLALIASGMLLFWRARTPPFPHGAAVALVQRGPYRYSRNPMYLSVILSYLGLAAVYWQPLALLLLPWPLALLGRVVIPYEEAQMTARFGDAYRDYCRRVRRWL